MHEKILIIVVACATFVSCLPQDTENRQQNGGSLDELINQIFQIDNSGIGINTEPTNTNPINGHSTYVEPQQPQQSNPPQLIQGTQQANVVPVSPTYTAPQQQQPTPNIVQGGSTIPSGPSKPVAPHNPCAVGECVPYYQCANGTIITDGEGLLDIRFGQEDNTNNEKHPCQGLFETCCSLRSETPFIPEDTKINEGCGIRNPDGVGFRITGAQDHEAQFGEFPWTVAILKEEKALDSQILNVYVCGGSLIDPGIVLTAAHCLHNKTPQMLKARLGEWDTQSKDEIFPHQDRSVREFVIHPDYYKGGLFNDIALLFLSEPAKIAENVNTVCLPPQDEIFDGSRCFASGWGKDLFGKEGKYQVILKRVELPIVPYKPCVEKLRETRLGVHFELHKSFICAGGERGIDTCKGDGGSPLVCPIKNAPGRYAQVGIVAWGIGCGDSMPGVYVNVPLFRNWIDEEVAKHKHSAASYTL